MGRTRDPLRRLARLHRQPLQPPVHARVAADPRRGDRRPRRDRPGAARGRRLPDGAVRAHGPDRDRRQPRGRPLVLSPAPRAALAAAPDPGADGRRRAAWAARPGAASTSTTPTAGGSSRRPAGELDAAAAASVLERVVCQLVNEACFAVGEGGRGAGRHRHRDAARPQPPAGAVRVGATSSARSASWRPSTRSSRRRRALPRRAAAAAPGRVRSAELTANRAVRVRLRSHVWRQHGSASGCAGRTRAGPRRRARSRRGSAPGRRWSPR